MKYITTLSILILCACQPSSDLVAPDASDAPQSPRWSIENHIDDLAKVYHLLDKKACQKIQKQALNQLSFVERSILSARIKLRNGHAVAALKTLGSVSPNALNSTQLESYLNTRSKIHQYRNQLTDQILDEMQLEQLTHKPSQRLWHNLGSDSAILEHAQPTVNGWLQLNNLLGSNFSGEQLQNWTELFPDHPANQNIHPLHLSPQISQVIIALPISKKIEHFNDIIQGLIVSYMADPATKKPTMKFIDTATDPLDTISQSIREEESTWIVASLNSPQLKYLTRQHPKLRILNLDGDHFHHGNVYSLGENQLYEAQHLAWHAMSLGYDHALFLYYDDPSNTPFLRELTKHWTKLGGETVDVVSLHSPNENDIIAQSMGIIDSKKRSQKLKSILHQSFHFIPSPRDDYDVMFLVMSPHQIKTVNPLLNYYFSNKAQRIASTIVDTHHPTLKKDKDLDGVLFPNDAYISLQPNQNKWIKTVHQSLKNEQGHATHPHIEHSTGINSYIFIKYFEAFKHMPLLLLSGSNGKMTLNNHQIFHHVNWITFKNGNPVSDPSLS